VIIMVLLQHRVFLLLLLFQGAAPAAVRLADG